jgi:hypothetical protein
VQTTRQCFAQTAAGAHDNYHFIFDTLRHSASAFFQNSSDKTLIFV